MAWLAAGSLVKLRVENLEKAIGAGDNPSGEKGIAKRLDALEARIAALEAKIV